MSLRDLTPFKKQSPESPDIFSPISSFQEEMNQFFNDVAPRFFSDAGNGTAGKYHLASVDISETDNAIEVTADMPGMAEDDIDITLNDDVLTLKGERTSEVEDEGKDYHRLERSYGTFMRRIALPTDVEEDKVSASFKKGVLKINLPKSLDAQEKSRRIKISQN